MKTCTKCKVEKDLGEFYKHKGRKDGLQDECKSCVSEYKATLKYRTDLKILAVPKECTTCGVLKPVAAYSKNPQKNDGLQAECKECTRDGNILRKYGLTPADHTALHVSQDGKCAICVKPIDQYDKHTHVDHCHDSGKVRALLCGHCNRGLGSFMDIPEVLEKGAAYLRHHKEKHNEINAS